MKYEEYNRKSAKEDIAFADGDQWSQDDVTKRTRDGRPTLTFNLCPIFIKQIIGNIRMNKPRIKVTAIGGKANKSVAAVFDGIIRKIEAKSNADEIYDEATKQMITGGFAYVRVDNVYASNDMFERDLQISWIPNQFAVYFDPLPFDLNKQNAEWAMVTSTMPKAEFEEKYPFAPQSPIPVTGTGDGASWFKGDEIRIAEYFEREEYEETLVQLSNGVIMIKDKAKLYIEQMALALETAKLTNPMTAQLAPALKVPEIIQERKVERHKVWRYLICGSCILEDKQLVPGELIPIIPILGDVNIVDGVRRVKGLVRDIKDPQRRLNYWVSTETEVVSNQPKSPWIATAAQIKGFEQDYKDANKRNISVLRYNLAMEESGQIAPPPQRMPPIQPSPGMLEAAASALNDMKMAAGIFGPSLGEAPAEDVSGAAMQTSQRASDVVSFIYADNLTRALKLLGKILIGMIQEVYDTDRIIRIKDNMDQDVELPINHDEINPITGLTDRINDLSLGDYGVEVITGPPYMTARMEARDGMLKFAQVFPEARGAIMDLAAKASDWYYADELNRRLEIVGNPAFRRTKPGDPPPQPTPQQQIMMAELQSKMSIAKDKAMYEKAKAMKMIAEAEDSKNSDVKKVILDTLLELLQGPQGGQGKPQPGQPPTGQPGPDAGQQGQTGMPNTGNPV